MTKLSKRRSLFSSPASMSNRQGMASLELVMGLPFLMFLIASIWAIGRVGLAKQAAAIQVRHYAWQQRLEPEQRSSKLSSQSLADPDHAMALTSIAFPGSGILHGETKQQVSVPNWLGGQVNPTAKTAMTVRTWSHREVDMSSSRPHFGLFLRMGEDPGGVIRIFKSIFNLGK